MPRTPKRPQKKTTTAIIDGAPVAVTLHPPAGKRTCWYAYWPGAEYARSTGHADAGEAAVAAQEMVRRWRTGGGGHRPRPGDAVMSDEEFRSIQRAHFTGSSARTDSDDPSLVDCLGAIDAFRAILDLPATEDRAAIGFTGPLAAVTAEECAKFQRLALTLPRNWRSRHPKSRPAGEAGCLSQNTVVKWSRTLRAAFQRANRNAGKDCVRGVVPPEKLLADNPWAHFTWVEGKEKEIRQYDGGELLSLLRYFDEKWPGVTVAPALAKVFLWSQCRRDEVTALRWEQLKEMGQERHFRVVGKWDVEKWFTLPEGLFHDLRAIRTDSPWVFAAYTGQLRRFHEGRDDGRRAGMVGEDFHPDNLAGWFYNRVVEWSGGLPGGHATIHVFRKTGLQYALEGESNGSRQVAADARVSEAVMKRHYTRPTDAARRAESNRNFARIVSALEPSVAAGYGHAPTAAALLEGRLRAALDVRDWDEVARLTAELKGAASGPGEARPGGRAGPPCEKL